MTTERKTETLVRDKLRALGYNDPDNGITVEEQKSEIAKIKIQLTPEAALFICTLIRLEKYRFNYGRKWHLERMRESIIKLPVTANGAPDWAFMERYIKTFPYSSQLQ